MKKKYWYGFGVLWVGDPSLSFLWKFMLFQYTHVTLYIDVNIGIDGSIL